MTSVILSGGMKMRDEHGKVRGVRTYTFLVMTSVILSGGMEMRDEHGTVSYTHLTLPTICSV